MNEQALLERITINPEFFQEKPVIRGHLGGRACSRDVGRRR